MAGVIKVSTSKLRSTASEFQNSANQIKSLTSQMTSIVNGLSGQIWTGEASNTYKQKFQGLNDDIEKMIKYINEHVSDLQQMAATYESAENENQSQASGLSSDVII